MTSQWPDNCDAITWIVMFNSLDIDFIHGDIHCRSCKNIRTSTNPDMTFFRTLYNSIWSTRKIFTADNCNIPGKLLLEVTCCATSSQDCYKLAKEVATASYRLKDIVLWYLELSKSGYSLAFEDNIVNVAIPLPYAVNIKKQSRLF